MKVWEGKQVVGFLLTWGLLQSQLRQQNEAKYHFLICLHWCPIGSYSSDHPQEKNLELSLWAKTDSFEGELWKLTDSFAERCM